jgi:Holliday junction DNA helicase RuvA
MIARISGVLAEVTETAVVIEHNGLGYEVLVPAYALGELAALRGRRVVLHTLDYLEGSATGGNFIPRLVGFSRDEDRSFFSRFITVKGIGIRKGLRALAQPIAAVATAIESGDTASLVRLPGIGKRAAEQIVAELRGKLEAFAINATTADPEHAWTQAQRDAVTILVTLGERNHDAQRWLERAMQLHTDIDSADAWVKAAYRIKTGAEG